MESKRGGARPGAGRKKTKQKISIRINDSLYEKLEKYSELYSITKTEVIERALIELPEI